MDIDNANHILDCLRDCLIEVDSDPYVSDVGDELDKVIEAMGHISDYLGYMQGELDDYEEGEEGKRVCLSCGVRA